MRVPQEICVSVPGSKSITNRALLIAALADGTTTLHNVLFSDDSRHFIQALQTLGFDIQVSESMKTVIVHGLGGVIPDAASDGERVIQVGSAGTCARFLTALLGLTRGRFHLDSSEQMKKRPMKELLIALENLGANISYQEERYHFPFVIGNEGSIPSEVTVDIDVSSQFLSALLIASVGLSQDLTIHVTGNHGFDYVEMTLSMMEQFGCPVRRLDERTFLVPKELSYQARDYEIEPDLSGACYFYGMGALLRVPTVVRGVKGNSLQGDKKFLNVLQQMGCTFGENEKGEKVLQKAPAALSGGCFDLSSFSDQALTLSVVAMFAKEPVTITGIGHIRFQECDRMEAIRRNVEALGGSVTVTEDSVTIEPGHDYQGTEIKTYEDHRVAMSFSLAALLIDNTVIENPMCCRKTFENFFDIYHELFGLE